MNAAMPFAVSRYFCVGERGESGCVISTKPRSTAGERYFSRKLRRPPSFNAHIISSTDMSPLNTFSSRATPFGSGGATCSPTCSLFEGTSEAGSSCRPTRRNRLFSSLSSPRSRLRSFRHCFSHAYYTKKLHGLDFLHCVHQPTVERHHSAHLRYIPNLPPDSVTDTPPKPGATPRATTFICVQPYPYAHRGTFAALAHCYGWEEL